MGVQERKERERRQRSNEILEAAKRLFEEKGFLKTTLQDVAQEAEVSVGLIYRYFQSKEDIFASLALKGAKNFDADIEQILSRAGNSKNPDVTKVLGKIAEGFIGFYGPYGEYFDMLMYSYKGMKEVQIQAHTLTRLMSVTLQSLDRVKEFVLLSPKFRAKEEDDALQVVFMLWGIMLGTHKLFDGSGRGHLFAFRQSDFIEKMLSQILRGICVPEDTSLTPKLRPRRKSSPSIHVH